MDWSWAQQHSSDHGLVLGTAAQFRSWTGPEHSSTVQIMDWSWAQQHSSDMRGNGMGHRGGADTGTRELERVPQGDHL